MLGPVVEDGVDADMVLDHVPVIDIWGAENLRLLLVRTFCELRVRLSVLGSEY